MPNPSYSKQLRDKKLVEITRCYRGCLIQFCPDGSYKFRGKIYHSLWDIDKAIDADLKTIQNSITLHNK